MTLRLHTADWDEVNAAFAMLDHIPDQLWQPIDMYLDGYGPLYQVIRKPDGTLSTARLANPPGHS